MAKRMTELAPKYLAAEHTGLHILFMSMANPIVIYSKTPIRKLEDFKGLKLRYASITNKFLLEAVGAVPLLIPPQESQDALAKGIADGAGFPHEAGLAYDLASVVKYAMDPPLASGTFALVMNPAKYNSLPPDLRAIIDKENGVAGAMSFGTAWQAQEKFARNLETTQKGLEITTLSARRRRQDESTRQADHREGARRAGKSRPRGTRILRGLYQVAHVPEWGPPAQAAEAVCLSQFADPHPDPPAFGGGKCRSSNPP